MRGRGQRPKKIEAATRVPTKEFARGKGIDQIFGKREESYRRLEKARAQVRAFGPAGSPAGFSYNRNLFPEAEIAP